MKESKFESIRITCKCGCPITTNDLSPIVCMRCGNLIGIRIEIIDSKKEEAHNKVNKKRLRKRIEMFQDCIRAIEKVIPRKLSNTDKDKINTALKDIIKSSVKI